MADRGGDVVEADRAASSGYGAPAFGAVRARGLLIWTIVGAVGLFTLGQLLQSALGLEIPGDLSGLMLYLPMVAWIWFVVVRRAGVDVRVMLRWPRLGGYWGVVVGMFVVQFVFSAGASILIGLLLPDIVDSLVDLGRGNLAAALVGVVVLPALVEETVFRGVLIERWALKWSLRTAILVSAFAFGILHVDPVGAAAFGVVTALLYVRTGSLWPGILIHGVNNLLALWLSRAIDPAESAAVEPSTGEALSTAAVLIAVSLPFLVWFIRANWPGRDQVTAYQRHEGASVPPRTPTGVRVLWSGTAGPVVLRVTDELLEAWAPGPAQRPIAVLPREHLRTAYTATGPRGLLVVLLLTDGSWTTMETLDGRPESAQVLAGAIAGRSGSWPPVRRG